MSSRKDTPNAINELSKQISELQKESRVQSTLVMWFTGVIAVAAMLDLILRLFGR